MLDISTILTELVDPTILIACLAVGYIIKKWVKKASNQIIPTVVFILGMILSAIIAVSNGGTLTVEIFVTGAISGLASTGLHQVLKTWLETVNNKLY